MEKEYIEFPGPNGDMVRAIVPKEAYSFIVYRRYVEPLSEEPNKFTKKMIYNGSDPEEAIKILEDNDYISNTTNIDMLRSVMDYENKVARAENTLHSYQFNYSKGIMSELGYIQVTPFIINPDKVIDMQVIEDD